MKNNWSKSSNNYYLREVSQQSSTLPPHVYKLNLDVRSGELYLSQVLDSFEFPYKIYGIEQSFVDRVTKTYHSTKNNIGILLNGVKGTGKTVTAQMICNKLELPVIIIHEAYDGIPSFLNELQVDVIVFFDEYEKLYNDYDHSILTVMDGVLNTEYRKTFILTTNSLRINTNLLQRPSRIRYVKTFGDLSLENILEIVEDKLTYTEVKDEVIKFISTLDTITIDIVKSVIDEVNIHREAPKSFEDIFNVESITDVCNVFLVKNKNVSPELKYNNAHVLPVKLTDDSVNEEFSVNGRYLGMISAVLDENTILIDESNYDEHGKNILVQYKLERIERKHQNFLNYLI